MIDKKTGIQYEIMTEKDNNGEYIPHLDDLIAESPNNEIKEQWEKLQELIEKTKDSEFAFGGFAFKFVCCTQRSCGHYEILQYPYNEQHDSVEEILNDFYEDNNKCTRCICDFK